MRQMHPEPARRGGRSTIAARIAAAKEGRRLSVVANPDLVRDADTMDDEFFCMHMSKRHQDSLAGQSYIEPAGDATEAYRAFHERLHRLRVDLEHRHEA